MVSNVMFKHIYPTDAHLLTAVVIANRVINSRPLTHVPTDDPSAFEAITPAHFLKWIPKSELGTQLDFDLEFLKPTSLRHKEMQRRRREQVMLHQNIWKQFQMAYLPHLRQYHANRSANKIELKKGDFALLQPSSEFSNAKHKKLFWERARIKDFLPSRDKIQRQVIVEKFNLDGKSSELTVPIQRLFPLETLPDVDLERYQVKDGVETSQGSKPDETKSLKTGPPKKKVRWGQDSKLKTDVKQVTLQVSLESKFAATKLLLNANYATLCMQTLKNPSRILKLF